MDHVHRFCPERQGTSMFLHLEGEALDAALDLHKDKISSKGGVKIIMARSDEKRWYFT